MHNTRTRPSLSVIASLGAPLLALSGISWTTVSSQPPLHEMSCFTIGSVVECIESGIMMPPMIIPGAENEGTDETFIIEDNGGYHEARG